MSLKARILRHSATPDRTHHECASAAASLSAAYEATIARMQATIDVQTAYIAQLHAEVDQARVLSGLPPKYATAPALMSSEVTR